jgi:probable rRNA maturation factor
LRLRLVDRFGGATALGAPFRAVEYLETLIPALGRPDWVVDLVLVDDRAMVQLNGSYRGVRDVTDVLSFSYLLPEGEGDPELSRDEGSAKHDLWLDPMEVEEIGPDSAALIGELILAPDFITTRCREHDWPLEHELPLLIVHGCLHLLGWEHDRQEDQRIMQRREAGLLRAVGLPHALAPDSGAE